MGSSHLFVSLLAMCLLAAPSCGKDKDVVKDGIQDEELCSDCVINDISEEGNAFSGSFESSLEQQIKESAANLQASAVVVLVASLAAIVVLLAIIGFGICICSKCFKKRTSSSSSADISTV